MSIQLTRLSLVIAGFIALDFSTVAAGSGFEAVNDCVRCKPLAAHRLHNAMNAIEDAHGLHIEAFYLNTVESPVRRPLNAVETGVRCEYFDPNDVSRYTARIKELSIYPSQIDNFESSMEIKVFRANDLLMQAYFTDGATRDAVGNSTTPALVNGEIATFYYKPVQELFRQLKRDMADPRASGHCTGL